MTAAERADVTAGGLRSRSPVATDQGGSKRNLERPPSPEPLPIAVFDNHTHLEFEDGIEQLSPLESLDRAREVNVAGVVQVGTDLETSRWSAELAEADHRVLAAVALHPNAAPKLAADGVLDEHLSGIAELASRPRVRAIGETGLDYFRTAEHGRAAQHASFEAHIAMAKEFDLALQIHDRNAHAEVVETLHRVGAPERTVFHCFSGGAELAGICAENGWYISFAGTVTFKNAAELRSALAVADPLRILVETDAPFLTPEPYRGRPNAPYLMPHTVRRMAEILDEPLAEFCERLSENTKRVYGNWESGS